MSTHWDGITERRQKASDHDTLIQLVEILAAHVKNADQHREDFNKHTIEDRANFKKIDRNMNIALGMLLAFQGFPLFITVINSVIKVGGH